MGDYTDWLIKASDRDNATTILDRIHPGDEAWSHHNLVRPLIHGATYFAELYARLEETGPGDLVYFTDWRGDADEQLTDDPDSKVVDVLSRADRRGADVRGLIWRSHWDKLSFSAKQNAYLGKQLQDAGAEVLLDMRVRTGGSHHQKFVVIRHGDDPSRDIAFVGGIDLCHSRRDTIAHDGDPQPLPMAKEYGPTPAWHDVQAAIQGPAVHDVETVFRERWLDPTPLSRFPAHWLQDRLSGQDTSPDPLSPQNPPPPPVPGGQHTVQLLRTYPNLRHGRDYPFARGGERSVARGYSKALERAQKLVYIEDQYLWSDDVAEHFRQTLDNSPDLHVIAVLPIYTDSEGLAREAELRGRRTALSVLAEAGGDRVAVYGIENEKGVPIYVHAKVCVMDDWWASIGSDNFNRRSWTHDSELSAVVIDQTADDHSVYARRLRLTLAAEHLGRELGADDDVLEVMADCVDSNAMFAAYAESAARLDAWYEGGQLGERPVGRLRRLDATPKPHRRAEQPLVATLYQNLHDPDGRPAPLRRQAKF
ncbi:phospholipase D family protein [Enemella evansiae]|uniref:phospholipase D family protein n=1 Tax=Enemella evansiae TaxID=2016499 RepID=UPI000B95E325|nr:phospholipase D-like domain-containing protein [Enemella evansiae]OYO02645.1 phospholipase [Enemella evansiae]OYO11984.1 phospholipase [Enemella evansiae]